MSETTARTTCQLPGLAYVGLGNMGLPIARHLTSYPSNGKLQVWNRSKDKYALIPEADGMDSIQDILQPNDDGALVVFTSFPSDEVAEEVYGIMVKQAEMGDMCQVIFVDQSTLQPTTSARIASTMPAGAVYLASPVIGQPAAAAAKQLVSVIAGNSEAIEYVKPILNFIGREIVVVSSDVSQASKMKLFVNMMLYGNMQVFSEVYALAEATGFPQDKLHEVFETVIPAPPLINYSNKISKGLFDGSAGFKIDGRLKDIRNILSMTDGLSQHLPLPTLSRVQASLEQVKLLPEGGGAGMSVESISAITKLEGGMAPFKDGVDFGQG